MHRLTAEHTGQEVATIERDSDRDRWFTAEQARGLRAGRRRRRVDLDDVRPAADRRRIGLA